MLQIRTILHPTDFSTRSARALELACLLAQQCGARVIVLHVIDYVRPVYSGVSLPPPPPPMPAEERNAISNQLNQIQAPVPGVKLEHRLVEGDPAEAILLVAQELNCDLIVMGTHGRTGLGRLLMGSVAENVLRAATCPVVTVRVPLPADGAAESGGTKSA
jgi:nucleotide-binding universal stress UspA family protein